MMRRSSESGREFARDGQAGHRAAPKTLSDALDAIGQLNEELLAALVHTTRRDSQLVFPLAESLRSRFAKLSADKCRVISHCGVLLVDAAFTDIDRWERVDPSKSIVEQPSEWLSQDQAIALSVAVLMLAWHVVHTAPRISGVLLGMSEAVLNRYRELGVNDLMVLACQASRWIQPRWINSPEVWTTIIDLATDPVEQEPSKMTLHCLKVTASYSNRLMASVSYRWPA